MSSLLSHSLQISREMAPLSGVWAPLADSRELTGEPLERTARPQHPFAFATLGRAARQRADLVGDDGEGIDVRGGAVGVAEGDLGRHVPSAAGAAGERVAAGRAIRIPPESDRETEIEEFELAVGREPKVVRLEVPMEDDCRRDRRAAVQEPGWDTRTCGGSRSLQSDDESARGDLELRHQGSKYPPGPLRETEDER